MVDAAAARARMVETQIVARGVHDARVLAAFREVPREAFVAPGYEEFAYDDTALPIAAGQTISQPYIVALMLEAAELAPGQRVLDVGAGSGYAAAVASRIADRVFAIERHRDLADGAEAVLRRLGYGNVVVRCGDGTLGWTDAAPFDAILVAAGGPEAPRALLDQLAVGGRLVMPVGTDEDRQRLRKVVRTGADAFEEEDLGAVMFVPLIGAQGWAEDGRRSASNHAPGASRRHSVPDLIREAAEPLPDDPDDPYFADPFERFGDRRVVLLGEASHGTAEFYRARAAITRRLIMRHGFDIVAVEADWPDAAAVDRHVGDRPGGGFDERPFTRFPTWMWRNTEVEAFVEWLRRHNLARPLHQRAGFYGLDIYNMSASIAAVLAYLDRVDPATYGRAVLSGGYTKCERGVVEQCRDLLARRLAYAAEDGHHFLDAAQNARLVASAERYYRIMYYGGAESWNLRDTHMFETLEHVLQARGPNAKAVVWAHNSHIGDARHTAMGRVQGELNLGQLCRERFGDQSALIGFGTHAGTVAAASDWGGPMEVKRVRPSVSDSVERLFHETGVPRCLVDFTKPEAAAVRQALLASRPERFIGVIYRPDTEFLSHYAEASLPRQFDAYVWFDETRAVTPLETRERPGMPETYPFGV